MKAVMDSFIGITAKEAAAKAAAAKDTFQIMNRYSQTRLPPAFIRIIFTIGLVNELGLEAAMKIFCTPGYESCLDYILEQYQPTLMQIQMLGQELAHQGNQALVETLLAHAEARQLLITGQHLYALAHSAAGSGSYEFVQAMYSLATARGYPLTAEIASVTVNWAVNYSRTKLVRDLLADMRARSQQIGLTKFDIITLISARGNRREQVQVLLAHARDTAMPLTTGNVYPLILVSAKYGYREQTRDLFGWIAPPLQLDVMQVGQLLTEASNNQQRGIIRDLFAYADKHDIAINLYHIEVALTESIRQNCPEIVQDILDYALWREIPITVATLHKTIIAVIEHGHQMMIPMLLRYFTKFGFEYTSDIIMRNINHSACRLYRGILLDLIDLLDGRKNIIPLCRINLMIDGLNTPDLREYRLRHYGVPI